MRVPCVLSVDGECPGDDLDVRGAGQDYPQQVAVIVVVLEEVAGLGWPRAGSGQAADGDLVDEVVPVAGLSMVRWSTRVNVSTACSPAPRVMAMAAVLRGAVDTVTDSRK